MFLYVGMAAADSGDDALLEIEGRPKGSGRYGKGGRSSPFEQYR